MKASHSAPPDRAKNPGPGLPHLGYPLTLPLFRAAQGIIG